MVLKREEGRTICRILERKKRGRERDRAREREKERKREKEREREREHTRQKEQTEKVMRRKRNIYSSVSN